MVFPIPRLLPVTIATSPAKERFGMLTGYSTSYFFTLSISFVIQLFCKIILDFIYIPNICQFL
jgi:hypothetical protein